MRHGFETVNFVLTIDYVHKFCVLLTKQYFCQCILKALICTGHLGHLPDKNSEIRGQIGLQKIPHISSLKNECHHQLVPHASRVVL